MVAVGNGSTVLVNAGWVGVSPDCAFSFLCVGVGVDLGGVAWDTEDWIVGMWVTWMEAFEQAVNKAVKSRNLNTMIDFME
jgi:hypothetical protein